MKLRLFTPGILLTLLQGVLCSALANDPVQDADLKTNLGRPLAESLDKLCERSERLHLGDSNLSEDEIDVRLSQYLEAARQVKAVLGSTSEKLKGTELSMIEARLRKVPDRDALLRYLGDESECNQKKAIPTRTGVNKFLQGTTDSLYGFDIAPREKLRIIH